MPAFPESKVIYYPTMQLKYCVLHRDWAKKCVYKLSAPDELCCIFLSSSLSFCRTMPFSFPCGQEVALRGAKTGFILRGVYLTVESVCWSTNIDDNWANVSSANASARPLLRIYHCTLLNMPMNSRSWRPRDGPITALCVRRPENNEVRSGIRLNQKRSI